jgi:hypothetical protein
LTPLRSTLVPLIFPLFSILHGSGPQGTGTIGGEAVTGVTGLKGARANQMVQWQETRATVIIYVVLEHYSTIAPYARSEPVEPVYCLTTLLMFCKDGFLCNQHTPSCSNLLVQSRANVQLCRSFRFKMSGYDMIDLHYSFRFRARYHLVIALPDKHVVIH